MQSKLSNAQTGALCLGPSSATQIDANLVLIECSSSLATAAFHNDDSALLEFPAVKRVAEVAVGSHTVPFVKVRPQVNGNEQQAWVVAGRSEFMQLKTQSDTDFCLEVTESPKVGARTMVKLCDSSKASQWFKFT